MQFQLQFRVQKLTLPLAYQYQLQSMLYHILQKDSDYGAKIHNHGFANGTKHFRGFCMSRLSGKCRISAAKEITFFEHAFLEVRTADSKLDEILRYLLVPGLQLELCGQPIVLETISIGAVEITENQCMIEMISPMVAYETIQEKTHYYTPLEQKFISYIEHNFQAKYQALKNVLPEPIQFLPYAVGIQDKCVTNYKGIYITGWLGKYKLIGKPEYLTFLYDAGLGAKNSSGFGMFRII